jgi:hypothetical protein
MGNIKAKITHRGVRALSLQPINLLGLLGTFQPPSCVNLRFQKLLPLKISLFIRNEKFKKFVTNALFKKNEF